jgi:subtilisin family serine protease
MTRTLRRRIFAITAVGGLVGAGLTGLSTTSSAAAAPKASPRANSLGVQVVRFAPGTTPAAMRDAVTKAGASVVTDLSPLGALAVVPKDASAFASSIKKQSGVRAAWVDRVSQSTALPPDPLHDQDAQSGENAPGVLQWEDDRDGVRSAWSVTRGAGIKVAVIDSGIDPSHRELRDNVLFTANTVPCNRLQAIFGPGKGLGALHDCSESDTDGHGTWVASRIVGAANGIGSNGIAPEAKVMGFKALATGFGGLTSWIVDAMVKACDADADVINMSLGGYNDPSSPDYGRADADDYFLWKDAVDYCRAAGTTIVASAGNEHVRELEQTVTLTGDTGTRTIAGAGVVSSAPEEGLTVFPGDTELERYGSDLRGMLETPAGVPGVIMVSSSGNTIAPVTDGNVAAAYAPPAAVQGTANNLAYYSSYGERVDVSAPGGARKYGVPKFDTRPGTDVLVGGWGQLGATVKTGDICKTIGGPADFACFTSSNATFGWFQGTSMSAPQVTGVAALAMAAHPSLQEHPDAVLAQLQSTARTDLVNHTGKTSAATTPAFDGTPCSLGYCHVTFTVAPGEANAIPFSWAYGAGMVDAAAAVS